MKKLDLVYIIDDDEVIMYLTGRLISNAEFSERVETFLNASEALTKLKDGLENGGELPDAILFDLNMPEIDGWQFIETFQKMPGAKKIPCFVFTTSIDPSDKNKSLKYKIIKDFITKPLTHQKLDKILRLVDKKDKS
ncbi:MAG TPA: response regulator [Bacteroidia bacterium]